MNVKVVVKRLLFFALVVWAASTIVFFVPRLSTRNAIRERFGELARSGGFSPGDVEKLIASMNKSFGLDKPLLDQYWQYLNNIIHLDFGYSLSKYPTTVTEVIAQSLPWTIGLLLVTTILAFVIGTLLGAVSAWPKAPEWLRGIANAFIMETLRRERPRLKSADAIVLATAQLRNRVLVTRNIEDFPAAMPGIRVPYTL